MHLIGQIIYKRKSAPEQYLAKRIGSLWWSGERNVAEVRLRGWRYGIAGIAYANVRHEPPYLAGDLVFRYTNAQGVVKPQWCGRIGTGQEFSAETKYWITLDVMPIWDVATQLENGLTLEVKQDDDDEPETVETKPAGAEVPF